MTERHDPNGQLDAIDPNDLDLLPAGMEDEGKDSAALWAEFDEADGEAAAPADPDQTPADEAGDGEGEGWSAAGDPEAGDPDNSAAQGGGEGSSTDANPADGKPPSAAQPQDTQNDIWASAPPELRAAHEAALKDFENRDRRLRGQVSALQRQINTLMSSPAPQQAAPKDGAAEGGEQGEGQSGDGFLASDEWRAFYEEYPDVAGPLAKVVGSLQSQLQHQSKVLAAIGVDYEMQAMEEQRRLLAEVHPDYEQVVSDQAHFVQWLETQPRHIREAAIRNANGIVDANEAADVVGRYKAFRTGQSGHQTQGGGNAQQPANPTDNRRTSRRQLQLQSATAARSRGPAAASGIPEDGDPEVIWQQFDEMERRQGRA